MDSKKITLKSGKKAVFISDCYNANPDSMGKVIDFCGTSADDKMKVFVLGDMKELGSDSKKAHEKIAEKIISSKADYIYLAGEEMKSCYEMLKEKKYAGKDFSEKVFYYTDKSFEDISNKINEVCGNDALILLKGSQSMSLEKIIPLLQHGEE